jgi:hypothetical protein
MSQPKGGDYFLTWTKSNIIAMGLRSTPGEETGTLIRLLYLEDPAS